MNRWRSILSMPDDGRYYLTRINDYKGIRNTQELRKQGNLFFAKDGTYVYYTPTEFYYPY